MAHELNDGPKPEPAKTILRNPSKEELDAFLDVVHSHNEANDISYSPLRIVLRGVANDEGTEHYWGSSFYHEHHDLKQGNMSLKNHLFVSTSGHIAKMGRTGGFEAFDVKGIGPKLKRVGTATRNAAEHPADKVLHNPSKAELQDLFTVTHRHLSAVSRGGVMDPDDAVLRGVVTQDGEHHVWGSSFRWEHEDLKDQSKNCEIQRTGLHVSVGPDGSIWKFGRGLNDRVPVHVSGIGLLLRDGSQRANHRRRQRRN
jgi:hypothetical protein